MGLKGKKNVKNGVITGAMNCLQAEYEGLTSEVAYIFPLRQIFLYQSISYT